MTLSWSWLLSPPAKALDRQAGATQAAIMPWQLLGLDAEFSVRHRSLLHELRQELARHWLSQTKNLDLDGSSQIQTLSLNQQRLSLRFDVGPSRAALAQPHHVQPIICPIGEHLLLGLELIASESLHVLAAAQILVPRAAWENFALPLKPPASPADRWQAITKELLQKANQSHLDVRQQTFKLRLDLLRGSQDSRLGSHLCLNHLLTEALLPRFTILSKLGDLEAQHLRQVWGISTPLLRATRELGLDWGMQATGPIFAAQARFSEAVRASSIDTQIQFKAILESRLAQLQLPEEFTKMLQSEADSLRPQDLPTVAHIYGAWAYLDRGRAWGLDINDRLYLTQGDRKIKGHVVGFFGAGVGLKSPTGKAIHEGAIIFIRKGQKKLKIGDQFHFDPTLFPTPWPAIPQPAGPVL